MYIINLEGKGTIFKRKTFIDSEYMHFHLLEDWRSRVLIVREQSILFRPRPKPTSMTESLFRVFRYGLSAYRFPMECVLKEVSWAPYLPVIRYLSSCDSPKGFRGSPHGLIYSRRLKRLSISQAGVESKFVHYFSLNTTHR